MSFKEFQKKLYKKYHNQLVLLVDGRTRQVHTEEQEIETSIGCWIRTRCNDISASMGCDYATSAIVRKLDEIVTDDDKGYYNTGD